MLNQIQNILPLGNIIDKMPGTISQIDLKIADAAIDQLKKPAIPPQEFEFWSKHLTQAIKRENNLKLIGCGFIFSLLIADIIRKTIKNMKENKYVEVQNHI